MAESSNRQKDIFLKAIDLSSADERAAFLAQACGSDVSLRRQVEAMLQANGIVDSFLEQPAAAMGPTVDELPRHPDEPAEAPGTRVGPYKLLQQVGEGGMGTVWMAEQLEPVRRKVALKLIKPGMDSAQVIARFEAERQALALMDHPHIAKVLDAGATSEGRPYFVMELVKGIAITKYCDDNQLTPRQRLALMIPVCHAVQHAHQKGLIHRDLKPSNVLIACYDGKPVPKVIDFGVAKAMGQQLTERTLFTGFGGIVGTLEYMSPEQAEFNALDVDTRSDIYSLGVLLYELLTGSPPLTRQRLKDAALVEVLRLIREEEPPKPSTRLSESKDNLGSLSAQRKLEPGQLAKEVRGEVDWIVMKALEKDRGRRYETANGMAQDIERYLTDEPVQAGPPSAGYRLRKFVKRNRGPVLAVSVLVLTLLAGITGTTWGLIEALLQRDMTEDARNDEAAQRVMAVNSEKKAKEQEAIAKKARDDALAFAKKEQAARVQSDTDKTAALFQALRAESARHAIQLDLALRAWEQHDVGRAEQILSEVAEPFQQTWEQRHVRALCRRKARLLPHPSLVNCTALSGDGRYVVSGNGDWENKEPREVRLWDAATGQEKLNLKGHTGGVLSVAISADGKRIVSGGHDGLVIVWDVALGRSVLKLKEHSGGVTSVAISADGRRVVSGSGDMTVKLWDAADGRCLFTFKEHTAILRSVAISSDGQRIVSGSDDKTVKLWNATTGKAERTLQQSAPVRGVGFSGDGKRVLAGGMDGSVKAWDVASGQVEVTLHVDREPVNAVAFSGDGLRVVTSNGNAGSGNMGGSEIGNIKVWDANTGKELLTLKGTTAPVISLAISDDGRRIVSGSWDQTVRVWDPLTSQEQRTLAPVGKTATSSTIIRSDGDSLVATIGVPRKVWNAATGEPKFAPKEDTGIMGTGVLNGHCRRIVTGDGDGVVRIWDADTGEKKFFLTGHTTMLHRVAIGNDGRRLVSLEAKAVKNDAEYRMKIWDAANGREIITVRTPALEGLAMSGDSERIALACFDRTVRVWDAATGKEQRILKGHTDVVRCVAFSDDGRRLVSGSGDNTVRMWDTVTGEEVLTLKGHTDLVLCVAISRDGQRIVSGSKDRKIKVWDVTTGQEKLTLKGHAAVVDSVAISRDGQRIVSGDGLGQAKVWEAPLADPAPRMPR